jgi:hypothetical protein
MILTAAFVSLDYLGLGHLSLCSVEDFCRVS